MIFLETAFEELAIEILQRGGLGQWNHRVPPGVAHCMLDLSFLMSFADRAEVRFEEIMRTKGNKGANFLAGAPRFPRFVIDEFDGSSQVVVADPVRNSSKVVKS